MGRVDPDFEVFPIRILLAEPRPELMELNALDRVSSAG